MAVRDQPTGPRPPKRLVTLAARLFTDPGQQQAFVDHVSRPGPPPRRCRLRTAGGGAEPPGGTRANWQPPLPLPAFVEPWPARPDRTTAVAGDDPEHDYVLDLSSVLAALPLITLAPPADRPHGLRALDLCAAPGGKTVFTWLALQPGLLLANEVIGKRLAILRHNLTRCGLPGERVFTQRLDPAALADLAAGMFDLVVCDAPCSGQSLPARGIDNPGAFHPATVQHNVKRQRRILAAAARLVKPGGHLFYSTCTFNLAENESNMRWLLRRFDPPWQAVDPVPQLPGLAAMRSPHADFPCFRFYPHLGHGGGGFSCLLQRRAEPAQSCGRELPAALTAWPVRRSQPRNDGDQPVREN